MNWRKTRCCGTCVHWDIDSARNKAGAVTSQKGVECCAVVVYPDSVPGYARSKVGQWMSRNSGMTCPMWQASKEYQP